MKRACLLLAAVLLAGCGSGPSSAPACQHKDLPIHQPHLYNQTATPLCFDVAAGGPPLDVSLLLENFYKGRCPVPVAELTLRAPNGSVEAHLVTQNIPFSDCVYTYQRNATVLAPGTWRVEYAGGSDALGSLVDVRVASAQP
jgi:hypothetical protein